MFILISTVTVYIEVVLAKNIESCIIYFLSIIIALAIYNKKQNKNENQIEKLECIDKPYSEKRITNAVTLLKKYNISPSRIDKIDDLTKLAKQKQIENDPLLSFQKLIKLLCIIFPFLFTGYFQEFLKRSSDATIIESILPAVCLSICLALIPYTLTGNLKFLFYKDYYYYYNYLISDLNDIKTFNSRPRFWKI